MMDKYQANQQANLQTSIANAKINEANAARAEAASAQRAAAMARSDASEAGDTSMVLALQVAKERNQVAAWRTRFEKERASRRAWQRTAHAAAKAVMQVGGIDREATIKAIDEQRPIHKAEFDERIAAEDKKLDSE